MNASEGRARRARVERVVAAGRRLRDPQDPLGAAARVGLSRTSGLSPEGIELALRSHLEATPTDAELEALLGRAGLAPRTHVVLSANVCTAPLRAIALAVATSPVVYVRPSRRDPTVAELLVRALAEDEFFCAEGGEVMLVDSVAPAPDDELHVYGSDASIAAIEAGLSEGVIVRGHGTGLGLAVVGEGASLDDAAREVASDVVPFDQRGCLSPRFVLVSGGAGRAERFADKLDAALSRFAEDVPRGPVDAALAAEIALYSASMQALGELASRPSHVVGVDLDPRPRALVLPPAARVVHVASVSPDDAARLLSRWAPFVTVVGVSETSPLTSAVLACVPFARRARLGEMQRPPLDGPVDLRPSSAPRRSAPPAGSKRSS